MCLVEYCLNLDTKTKNELGPTLLKLLEKNVFCMVMKLLYDVDG